MQQPKATALSLSHIAVKRATMVTPKKNPPFSRMSGFIYISFGLLTTTTTQHYALGFLYVL